MRDAKHEVTRRRLGAQERYLHNLHKYGGLIAIAALDIEGPLDGALVRRGLDWLQRRHPILRAHLVYSGFGATPEPPFFYRQPWFETEGTASIPLAVMSGATEAAVATRISEELRRPISGKRAPRMRAVLAHMDVEPARHRLLVLADHTVGDAQACSLGLRDLMRFFADPDTMEAEPVRTGLPPALEELTPPRSDSGTRGYQPAIRLPAGKSKPDERETFLVRASLSRTETEALKSALKAERATLHGLVTASILIELGEMFGRDELTTLSNVELRRMCAPPLPADTYGCYIDILRSRHRVDQPVGDLAREVSFGLIALLAHDQASASVLKMPTFEVFRIEGRLTYETGMRLDALAVTTAGETGLERAYGPFTLHDVALHMSLHVIGASLFAIAFEIEGALHLQMNCAHPNLSRDQADTLVKSTADRLRGLGAAAEVA